MASVRYISAAKRFGPVTAVDQLSLDIDDGEFMVLVGPSGSGKTTALRMLAGLESITAGEIHIDGTAVNRVAPRERDIAMVFQDYALYPQMTVFNNLAFGLRRRKMDKAEIRRRVEEAAQLLDIARLLDRKPGQLSGGQAQRVALGRALVRQPRVFLMDEPLSNLDAKLRTQTRGEIKRLQQKVRTTTVFVTHDQVEAMTMGDRIAVMNDGRLEQVGTPAELYERPANRFVAGFIGSPGMSFVDAHASDEDGGVRLRADGGFDLHLPVPAPARGDIVVGIRPEAARLWEADNDGLAGPVPGTVAYIEALGRETFVGIDVGDSRIAAYQPGRSNLAPGDPVTFGILPHAVAFFAPESGEALAPAQVAARP
jgi:multiple sugar transport system ATP-binding protein